MSRGLIQIGGKTDSADYPTLSRMNFPIAS